MHDNRTNVHTPHRRIDGLLWRIGLPIVALLAAIAPAHASASPSGPRLAHLHSPAMEAAASEVVLGAGAATVILAGMAVVLAVSWRGFRDSLRIDIDDEPPIDGPRTRTRPTDEA